MTDAQQKMPVVTDDFEETMMAVFKRIESVPLARTMIDDISDEEWLSDEPDSWNITAGSSVGVTDLDFVDVEPKAA